MYLVFLLLYYAINYSNVKVPIYNVTYVTILKILLPVAAFFFLDFFYYGVLFLFVALWLGWVYVYVLILGVLLVHVKKNANLVDTNRTIHLCLLFFLAFSTLQYYIFSSDFVYDSCTHISVCLLKFNQFTKCVFTTQHIDYLYMFKDLLVSDLLNVRLDTITITKDSLFNHVFSKSIVVDGNLYFEKVNQGDNQLFVNYILYQIFLTLLFLLLFFSLTTLTKKRIVCI